MAAAALTPRVRIMAVCDGIRESKTEPGVFHLKGVRQGITADAFPFPARLWLFLLLSSPRAGTFPGHVQVLNEWTDKAIFIGQLAPPPRFPEGSEFLPFTIRTRCSFPAAGRYTFQVWFFQPQGSDVLKGELPFYVIEEGA